MCFSRSFIGVMLLVWIVAPRSAPPPRPPNPALMSLKVLGKCDACAKLIGCLNQSQFSILLHCPMRGQNRGHMERTFRVTPQETGASWQFWADGALMLRLGKENMGMKFFSLVFRFG